MAGEISKGFFFANRGFYQLCSRAWPSVRPFQFSFAFVAYYSPAAPKNRTFFEKKTE
jgi:hypothetical protein